MILYFKDTKNSTQKLLDTINSFSKVAGYKINLKKSYMEIIPLTKPSKKMTYIGVNLT
jgi:hypothetical protein